MKKTLVLVIDGASYDCISEWADRIPVFKLMKDGGIFAKLCSTLPPLTCPAVPTFYTGKNSGKTGVTSFTTPDGKVVSSRDIKEETVWEILNDYGMKTLVYYMPITYPPKKIDGVMVTGYGTPHDANDFVCPRELLSVYDFPTPHEEHACTINNVSEATHLSNVKNLSKRKFATFKKLETEKQFDVSFFFLEDSDVIQHFLWHKKELVFDYFAYISPLLDDLLKSINYDNVIILSDHGFQAIPANDFYLNGWLAKEGYLMIKYGWLGKNFYPLLYSLGQKYLSLQTLVALKNSLFKVFKSAPIHKQNDAVVPGIDFSRTKAFAYHNWGIFLQKKVLGENYDSTREEIISKLRELKDGEKAVFKEVKKREDVFSGKYVETIPDIVMLANPQYDTNVYLSKDVVCKKTNYKKVNGRAFTGIHDYAPNGILFMYGKDIAPREIKNASILDIMPTLLTLYDIPSSPDIDGKALDCFQTKKKAKQNKNNELTKISSAITQLKV